MASITPAALPANTQLCDYCHQKPKHGTHSYCSKTCAAQTASTLCNYCQKKPKFQNFDYCGKNCAALAAAGTPAAAAGNRATKNPASAQKPAVRSGGNAPAAGAQAPAGGANSLMDPVQLAKLVAQHLPKVAAVAQHIPQVQSFLAAVAPAQAQAQAAPPPANGTANPMPAPPPAPVATTNPQPKQPRNNPFLNAAKQLLPNGNAPAAQAAAPNAAQAPAPLQPGDCLVPGCGQPVHVDSSGVMSEYCSMKHREEAVSLGLVPPCIMCLTRPQSDTDYFCGRDCREEAMSKSP
ncbi:hypothetical protein DFH08DRAFT_129002 [Mycena albidolilacea]|uniref:Uncharacterized protein n=1 Tax=Mycena albidolilacea TaxID=1033008 RepID=A0AAD7E7F1_9AGAR|nr:hypothetical protein DFH08DRAFT_129002 [Mycena albidolilacea]